MNIQESIAKLEEERDMYWHMFISSREKGYSSQTEGRRRHTLCDISFLQRQYSQGLSGK